MPPFLTDVRSALRSLASARGFTATAIVTLGLGMALCATTLVVLDAYLMRGLPYPAAERLYWVRYGQPDQTPPRGMETRDWTSLDDAVEQQIAWDLDMFYLVGREHTEQAPGAWVTLGFVEGFGIRPAIGAGFDADAFTPGSPNVALISHALWTTRFGGDPAAVGQTFTAYVSDRPEEAESFTIVGVLPVHFWHFNPYTDILVPLRVPTYPYMVRLREPLSPQQAAARIAAVVATDGGIARPVDVQLESAHGRYTLTIRPMLRAAMAAAVLVLLVACANVAALLLVRATGRQKDLAVRVALGAGRGALARTLATEAVLLATGATLLAALATTATLGWLGPAIQEQVGRSAPGGPLALTLSVRMAAGIVAIGIATTLLCALAPLVASRVKGPATALQSTGRASTAGAASRRLRAALIASEIAISLALLSGAALMLRTIVTLTTTEWGVAAERVSTTGLALRQTRYPDTATRADVFNRLLTRLRAMPDAESVALTTASLVQQPQLVEAGTSATDAGGMRTAVHRVTDGYFTTLGIPMREGRPIAADDTVGREPVAVVSATLAQRLWSAGGAIGQQLVTLEPAAGGETRTVVRSVVGVAQDFRQAATDDEHADVYVPLMQQPGRFAFAVVRTAHRAAGGSSGAADHVRLAVRDVDPEIAVNQTRPLRDLLKMDLTRPRFMTALLSALALTSALLALVGVYGLVAYAVRQREREIAIRVAIGAEPGRITRLFLSQGSGVLAAGLLFGIAGALATRRLLETQLVGVATSDPATLVGSSVAFAGAALAAMWWPSRRAAATEPATALRGE